MALTALERTTIRGGIFAANKALNELYPILTQLNAIYDSGGGAKTTITQPNLDLDPTLSGLTKTQLDDGMFALTSTLKNDIGGAITQLAQLAARINPNPLG